jgi:hypothetical protein
MAISREMLVASGLAVIIISGAFYVNAGNERIDGEVVAVAEAPARTYIQAPDSDKDGVSDWAEELIADREVIADSVDPEEPYVLKNTLTERFSIDFFKDYLYSKGLDTVELDREQIIERAMVVLKDEARDRIYTFDDITLTPEDTVEAQRIYGNKIAEITISYTNPASDTELNIINRALETKNPELLKELDPIIASYRAYFEQTLATPVPESFARQHVDLINVYNAILNDLTAMQAVYHDPMLGLLRLKRYPEDVEGLIYVYFSFDRAFRQAGITFKDDEPGGIFNKASDLRDLIK